jgi:hypothetical protein
LTDKEEGYAGHACSAGIFSYSRGKAVVTSLVNARLPLQQVLGYPAPNMALDDAAYCTCWLTDNLGNLVSRWLRPAVAAGAPAVVVKRAVS